MMLNLIKGRAERAIREKVFPGCIIGVSRNGTREILPLGGFTYEADSAPVIAETVYDLASITKSIPTASLALVFAQEGRLKLADKVKQYIPELQNDFGVTIEDLLLYRVKGPRMAELNYPTFEQIRTHIFERGFDGPSGAGEYANVPAYVLGVVVERVGGASLAALADRYFFGPLGMSSTTFFPAASDCVPTEIQSGEVIQGVVHDESARVFSRARRATGHAGLFSTADDLLRFADALLCGEFPEIVAGAEKGLGWHMHQEWFMGTRVTEKTFGKTGFTGTSLVIDREKQTALVILSNRTYPRRPLGATSLTSAINILRKDIADIVFGGGS